MANLCGENFMLCMADLIAETQIKVAKYYFQQAPDAMEPEIMLGSI